MKRSMADTFTHIHGECSAPFFPRMGRTNAHLTSGPNPGSEGWLTPYARMILSRCDRAAMLSLPQRGVTLARLTER